MNKNFFTQKQINELFAGQERRLLRYLAKYGVEIPEDDIRQQEEDFANEHAMDASELGFWDAYKSAFNQRI